MNTRFRPFAPSLKLRRASRPLALGLLGLGLLALTAPLAPAQLISFNITNCLSATNPIVGFPTNSVSTNTLPQGTGGALSVANNEFVLFCFKAYCPTNIGGGSPTTNNVVIQLIRSASANPPGVTTGTNLFSTNAAVILSADWETWSNSVPYGSQMTIPISQSWGFISWKTNLPQQFVSGANWLGIAAIYPNGTNLFLTNVVAGIAKKIIPIRYP